MPSSSHCANQSLSHQVPAAVKQLPPPLGKASQQAASELHLISCSPKLFRKWPDGHFDWLKDLDLRFTHLGLNVRQFASLLCWLAEEVGSHLKHGGCLGVYRSSLYFVHPRAHILLDEILQL